MLVQDERCEPQPHLHQSADCERQLWHSWAFDVRAAALARMAPVSRSCSNPPEYSDRPKPSLIAFQTPNRHISKVKFVLPLLFVVAFAPEAAACLGQPEARIREESRMMGAPLQRTDRKGYVIFRIERADGTVITQYMNARGLVFAIAWQAPSVPDFRALLGGYFSEFQQALQSRKRRSGALSLQTKNLVVESLGHMRAFHGRIYVPGLLPEGLTAAVVQ